MFNDLMSIFYIPIDPFSQCRLAGQSIFDRRFTDALPLNQHFQYCCLFDLRRISAAMSISQDLVTMLIDQPDQVFDPLFSQMKLIA